MRKSEAINELAVALVAAQSDAHNVGFDKQNPHFHSAYTSLAMICEEVRPNLAKHGLAVLQLPGVRVIEGKVEKVLCTCLLHTSGQWVEEDMILNPPKDDPQGQGSAITYARRYTLPGIGCFASSDNVDDDGEAACQKPLMTAEVKKSTLAFIPTITEVKELVAYWNELQATFDLPEGSPLFLELKAALSKQRQALSNPANDAPAAQAA